MDDHRSLFPFYRLPDPDHSGRGRVGRPLEVTFRGVFPTERLWDDIARRVGGLRSAYPALGCCHVRLDQAVSQPPRVCIIAEAEERELHVDGLQAHLLDVQSPLDLDAALDATFDAAWVALAGGDEQPARAVGDG